MFFYRDVEKLRYRTEVYNIWAWVSGAFSIGAAYKYIENTWSGYLFISIGLLLLAVSLIASAKKIKRKIIKIETEDRKDEIKQEDDEKAIVKIKERLKKRDVLKEHIARKKHEDNQFLTEIKSRSLEENIKLLNSKYKSLSSKEKIASYGEYEEALKWLKFQYKEKQPAGD